MKKTIHLLIIICIVALTSVSLVNANTDMNNPTIITHPLAKQIPLYTGPFTPADPPKMISIVFPERELVYSKGENGSIPVDAQITDLQLISAKTDLNLPNTLILPQIKDNESIAVLTIPKEMFDYLSYNQSIIRLKFEKYYFKFYPEIAKIPRLNNKNNDSSFNNHESIKISSTTSSAMNVPPGWIETDFRKRWNAYLNRSITYVTGKIQPYNYDTWGGGGSGYDLIQEKEIYLTNSNRDFHGDVVELVLEYHDPNNGNNIVLLPVIYNEGQQIYPGQSGFTGTVIQVPSSYLHHTDYSHSYDYYVWLGTGSNVGDIQIYLYDNYASTWYSYYYHDYTPSTVIHQITGSSETYTYLNPTTSYAYEAWALYFWDQWDWIGGSWSRPSVNFYPVVNLDKSSNSIMEMNIGNSVIDFMNYAGDGTLMTSIENYGYATV